MASFFSSSWSHPGPHLWGLHSIWLLSPQQASVVSQPACQVPILSLTRNSMFRKSQPCRWLWLATYFSRSWHNWLLFPIIQVSAKDSLKDMGPQTNISASLPPNSFPISSQRISFITLVTLALCVAVYLPVFPDYIISSVSAGVLPFLSSSPSLELRIVDIKQIYTQWKNKWVHILHYLQIL